MLGGRGASGRQKAASLGAGGRRPTPRCCQWALVQVCVCLGGRVEGSTQSNCVALEGALGLVRGFKRGNIPSYIAEVFRQG